MYNYVIITCIPAGVNELIDSIVFTHASPVNMSIRGEGTYVSVQVQRSGSVSRESDPLSRRKRLESSCWTLATFVPSTFLQFTRLYE